jgi:magnesium and cobalt transporter
VPQRGEVIVHPIGFEFEVMEADPRRIRRLRIRPRAPLIDGVAAPQPEPPPESLAEVEAAAEAPARSVFLPDERMAGRD